jgi:ribosomal protein S27E
MEESAIQGKIKQMRNLAMFKEKSDEEIREWILMREARQQLDEPEKPVQQKQKPGSNKKQPSEEEQEQAFQEKLIQLQKEYGIDMNSSNDAEMLKGLVRQILQAEIVDRQIAKLQREDDVDTRTLKNLGDYQRSLYSTMTVLEDKLGIGRRQRKEKKVDTISQFVDVVRKNAGTIWDRTTSNVRCERCEITLATYWINFPKKAHMISMTLECWKCGEQVVYTR